MHKHPSISLVPSTCQLQASISFSLILSPTYVTDLILMLWACILVLVLFNLEKWFVMLLNLYSVRKYNEKKQNKNPNKFYNQRALLFGDILST